MEQDWHVTRSLIQNTFIEREMQRTNRNLLITSLIILLCIGAYFTFEWRYYYNFFHGPLKMSAETLDHLTDPGKLDRYYVTLTGEREIDTGFTEVETGSGSETLKAKFVAIDLGQHHLIVKKSPGETGPEYTGQLIEMPADVKAQIIDPVMQKDPEYAHELHPFMLDTTGFRHDGYWGLGISIPFLLIALWILRLLVRRTTSPETHPVLRALAHHGPIVDVVQKIDADIKSGFERFMQLKITREWILYSDNYSLKAMRLDEVVWLYKKITRQRVNFIPTAKIHSLVLTDRYATSIESLGGKEKKLDAFIQTLVPRLPNAVIGFHEDLQKLQQKNAKALAEQLWESRPK
jgi:hypothetical protein